MVFFLSKFDILKSNFKMGGGAQKIPPQKIAEKLKKDQKMLCVQGVENFGLKQFVYFLSKFDISSQISNWGA